MNMLFYTENRLCSVLKTLKWVDWLDYQGGQVSTEDLKKWLITNKGYVGYDRTHFQIADFENGREQGTKKGESHKW